MTHWYHLQKTKTAAAALALVLVSSSWTSVKAQISLNVSQTTLGAVIQKIQKQSKYQFTYDDNLAKMQVNAVQVKNGKVEDVLNKLLKDKGVSYVIKDGIIYLKKKRKKAPKQFKKRPHIVQPGESMYSISQKYGIRLKSLYSKNHLEPDFKIYPGARLKVR